MNMFEFIECKNPFDPSRDRTIRTLPVEPEKPISEYLPEARRDERISVSVNGHIVDAEELKTRTPKPGDWIVVCHRPGDWVTPLVGWVAGLIEGIGVQASIATALAWGATLYVGGLLLQSLYQIPDVSLGDSGEQTYGWNSISSQEGQGGAISETFGTVRTAGQVLARHITTDGDKQYLNLLLSCGAGELDSIIDILINGNPVENYDGVEVDTRLGTNTQSVMANFHDAYADQALTYKLATDKSWSTHSTIGDGGEGLEITLEWPSGLYRILDDGNLGGASVSVTVQYKLHADAEYTDWGTWTITGSSRTALRRTFRMDNLTAGQYDVRVAYSAVPNTGSRYSTDTYWTLLSHIIYDDFAHPGIGLVGIKALATDQLNSTKPTVTWVQTRSTMYAWNPTAEEYQEKPVKNVAWACYDAIHQCRKLDLVGGGYEYVVEGSSIARLDYDAFDSWATLCESLGLYVNIIIDKAQDLWKTLNQKIAPIGRGCVIMRGTKYSCIFDAAATPVQLFGEGNIVEGSFEEEFLPVGDRANAVELTFKNAAKDYESDVAFVMGDTYNESDTVPNPVQIHYDGITDYEQAYRHAAYRLRVNKLVRVIKFSADIDSIACQVNDVINVAHRVPAWGESGRVLAGSTSTTVVLDQPVTLAVGSSYIVLVRHADDTMETKTVEAVLEETTTATLTLTSAWTSTPAADDVYAFALESPGIKPFRVTAFSRDGELRKQLTCLEYSADLYDEATAVEIPDYSAFNRTATNLRTVTTWGPDGKCFVGISWTPPRLEYGGAKVTVDGVQVASVDASTTSYVMEAIPGTTYDIAVTPRRILGGDLEPVTLEHTTDAYPVPATVAGFGVLVFAGDLVFSWAEVDQTVPAVQGYEIRRGDTWESAVTVLKISGKSVTTGATSNILRGDHTYWIAAWNVPGNYSSTPASVNITITSIPEKNIVKTVDDAEEAASVTGYVTLEGGVVYQHGSLTYADLSDYTVEGASSLYPYQNALSGGVVTFAAIDIGKVCKYTVLIDIQWIITPDAQMVWEYRVSDDDVEWSAWVALTLGEITSQYLQLRAVMNGTSVTGICKKCDVYIDVPEQTQKWREQTIDVGGTAIAFNPAFVDTPSILVTPLDDNRFVKLTSYDNEGVTIQVTNASETDVGGKVSVEATGF